jgi:dephospho-CoA kinase
LPYYNNATNETKVIALVGMPEAGKGLCVEYLEKRNWPSVYLGRITVDEFERHTRQHSRKALFARHGHTAVRKHLVKAPAR